ncbi:unnamed protein product [Lactuca virosa]|uniref:Uncharacterized protein n=1 Tax=Lactuca virosa TaxID=75947 RepID=A0AAU9LMY0_9ASTR|nr:unnamed protein product [Lactuca virosa]
MMLFRSPLPSINLRPVLLLSPQIPPSSSLKSVSNLPSAFSTTGTSKIRFFYFVGFISEDSKSQEERATSWLIALEPSFLPSCTYSVQRLLTIVIWTQLHMKLFPPALRICFTSSESFLFQNVSFSIAIVLHCFIFSQMILILQTGDTKLYISFWLEMLD